MNFDLETLWRAKFTLLLFTLGGLGAGFLYLQITPTTYEAQARVLIEPRGISPDEATEGRVVPEFIPTQAETIRSPITISAAVEKIRIVRPPQADVETFDPIQHVLKSLVVTPILNANVVTISYRSIDENEATGLLEEIVDAYRTFINEMDEDNSGTDVQLLTAREEQLRNDLRTLEREYEQLRKENPTIGQGRDGNMDAMSELDLLARQLAQVSDERRELQGRLESVFGIIRSDDASVGKPKVDLTRVDVEMNFEIARDESANWQQTRVLKPSLDSPQKRPVENMISVDSQQIEEIIRYSDPVDAREIQLLEQNLRFAVLKVEKLDLVYGDRHPELIAAKAEVVEYQTLLQHRLINAVKSWQRQLSISQKKEAEIEKEYQTAKGDIKKTEVFLLQEANLQRNIDNLQRLHGSTLEQLLTLQSADNAIAEGRNSVYIRVLDGPLINPDLTWPDPKLLLAGSICVGFLLGFSFVAFREYQNPESALSPRTANEPTTSGAVVNRTPDSQQPVTDQLPLLPPDRASHRPIPNNGGRDNADNPDLAGGIVDRLHVSCFFRC